MMMVVVMASSSLDVATVIQHGHHLLPSYIIVTTHIMSSIEQRAL